MLKFELGKSYLCVKVTARYPWFTVGKVYETIEGINEPYILSDTGMKWYSSDRDLLQKDGSATFTEFSSDEFSSDESVKSYTTEEVNKVIAKAHQYFNDDSQRLAYIRGYFAK